MIKSVSRLLMAGSAVAALALTTACGGGSGGGGSEAAAKVPAKVPAKPEGAKALTAAQLEKAVVGEAELKGYKLEKTPDSDIPDQFVPATPAACQPLADMFLFSTQPAAKARVARTMTGPDETDATVTSVGLLAHEEADAKKIVAGLRTASTSCKAYEHATLKYSGVKALADPKKGDESVSYQLEGDIEGDKLRMTFTVVRSGSTIASFYAMNILEPAKAIVPPAVIDAQLAKLAKVK